jgi:hypothetical protein
MLTSKQVLCSAFFLFAIRGSAFAQITIPLGDPGFEGAVSAGLPSTSGSWAGDLNSTTTAENGITPLGGSGMLRFTSMAVDGTTNGTGSDTVQLVDLSPYLASIAAGTFTTTFSANFNRTAGSTINQFEVIMRAYSGTVGAFPANLNSPLATQFADLFSDSNPATWEQLSVTMTLPTSTTYLAVWVSAISPANVATIPAGNYADNAALTTTIPEPSTCAALAGLGTLGLVAQQRRKRLLAA